MAFKTSILIVSAGSNAGLRNRMAGLNFTGSPPGINNVLRVTAWATYCGPDEDWSSIKCLSLICEKGKALCSQHFEDYYYTDNTRTHLTRGSTTKIEVRVLAISFSIANEVVRGRPSDLQFLGLKNVTQLLDSLRIKLSVPLIAQQMNASQSQEDPVAGWLGCRRTGYIEGPNCAGLLAGGAREAGYWLPIRRLTLVLDSTSLRLATGLRLGVPVCMPHIFSCAVART